MMSHPFQRRFGPAESSGHQGRQGRDSRSPVCVGCGCDNDHACFDQDARLPCHWIRLEPGAGKGLCSACPELAEAWDRGKREFRVMAGCCGMDQMLEEFMEESMEEPGAWP
jgi:hypothetical protein